MIIVVIYMELKLFKKYTEMKNTSEDDRDITNKFNDKVFER